MAISLLPVDQRVIDIDSRRFASIEKAIVELITNSDDSYSRLEAAGEDPSGRILISYERHQRGAILSVSDQAEGMDFAKTLSILSYGGAHSRLALGEPGGRGYFGRGLKQAVYGLGHGWIESVYAGRYTRVDLYRSELGEYLIDDGDGDREAREKDYERLNLEPQGNGTRITIIIDNTGSVIPYFSSLVKAVSDNFYLRDILGRRTVDVQNLNQSKNLRTRMTLRYEEPEAQVLIGPEAELEFHWQSKSWPYRLTLKKALHEELVLKGDERTNGLLVLSGTAVLDCQFFRFENQLGTEYLFGEVRCDALAELLSQGHAIISDEREGLNLKDPFVAAFADAVSAELNDIVKSEQLRLSHFDHARTSGRTRSMIEQVLQEMNRIASGELGIILPPGPGNGQYGPYDTGRPAALRFSTPFYYRKVGHPFHVKMIADRAQLPDQEILAFSYDLPESISAKPALAGLAVADLPEDGSFLWTLTGSEIGAKGRLQVRCGPFAAVSEVVIAENASGSGFGYPSGRQGRPWVMDNSTELFRGYELRNLDNDMDRAIYDPEERLILINTEAPTVRLYVDAHGQFKDGARLLLAELLLDIISGELARRTVDRTTQAGDSEAYQEVKHDLIRRYGVLIHSILLGGLEGGGR